MIAGGEGVDKLIDAKVLAALRITSGVTFSLIFLGLLLALGAVVRDGVSHYGLAAAHAIVITGGLGVCRGIITDSPRWSRAGALVATGAYGVVLLFSLAMISDGITTPLAMLFSAYPASVGMCLVIAFPSYRAFWAASLVAMINPAATLIVSEEDYLGIVFSSLCEWVVTVVYVGIGLGISRVIGADRTWSSSVRGADLSAGIAVLHQRQIHDVVTATFISAFRGRVSGDTLGESKKLLMQLLEDSEEVRLREGVPVRLHDFRDKVVRQSARATLTIDRRPTRRGLLPGSAAAAALEAIRNCERHSCAPHVHVRLTGDGGTITIQDDGGGFDVESAVETSFGIRESIVQRMENIDGGTARITSTPSGTTVVLSWREGRSVLDAWWRIGTLREMNRREQVIVGVVAACLAAGLVLTRTGEFTSLPVALTLPLLLGFSLPVLISPDLTGSRLSNAALTAAVTGVALNFSISHPTDDLNALLPAKMWGAALTLSLVFSSATLNVPAALGAILASTAYFYDPAAPLPTTVTALGATYPLLWALGARFFFQRALLRATKLSTRGLTMSTAGQHSTLEKICARGLRLIEQMPPVSDTTGTIDVPRHLRTDCGAVGAAFRDLALAPRLIPTQLWRDIDAARQRGLSVKLVDANGELSGTAPPLPDSFIKAVHEALARATPDAQITVRVNPPNRPIFGTITSTAHGTSTRVEVSVSATPTPLFGENHVPKI